MQYIENFSGGQNTKISQHLLSSRYFVHGDNVNASSGSIIPYKKAELEKDTTLSNVSGRTHLGVLYDHNEGSFLVKPSDTLFREHSKNIFYSQSGKLRFYKGGKDYFVGLPVPTGTLVGNFAGFGGNLSEDGEGKPAGALESGAIFYPPTTTTSKSSGDTTPETALGLAKTYIARSDIESTPQNEPDPRRRGFTASLDKITKYTTKYEERIVSHSKDTPQKVIVPVRIPIVEFKFNVNYLVYKAKYIFASYFQGKFYKLSEVDDVPGKVLSSFVQMYRDKIKGAFSFFMIVKNTNLNKEYVYADRYNLTPSLQTPEIINFDVSDPIYNQETRNPIYGSETDKIATVQYCYTYYNSVLDIESAPSNYTKEIDVYPYGYCLLRGIQAPPSGSGVDKIRIYRIGGDVTKMTLCHERDLTDTSGSYREIIFNIGGNDILDSFDNYPPPEKVDVFEVHQQRLFLGEDSKVRWSNANNLHSFPPKNSFELEGDITGILSLNSVLLIFTQFSTYALYGNSSANFSIKQISSSLGCINKFTPKNLNGKPFWVSQDGICSISNGKVYVDSESWSDQETFDAYKALVHQSKYYLLLKNGKIIVLDYSRESRVYTLDLGEFKNIIQRNNKVLGIDKNFAVYVLHGSSEDAEIYFLSPKYTQNDYTRNKKYAIVNIQMSGKLDIKVYVDDKEAHSNTYEGTKLVEIQPNAMYQRGYSIQIEAKGSGSIYSIKLSE